MNRKSIGIIIVTVLVLWIGLIFYFLSQPSNKSNTQSGMVIKGVKKVDEIFDITETRPFQKLVMIVKDKLFRGRYRSTSAVVRKSAHFGIYFVLGIICSVFGYYHTKKILITFLLGVSLSVVVAVLDEFNQGLVGRTSSLRDVLIDGSGALVGTVVVIIVILVRRIGTKFGDSPLAP